MRGSVFRRWMATIARLNRDGSTTNIQIRPSYAHKPKAVENLMKGLPELFESKTSSTPKTNVPGISAWKLDDSGDTIHRHISLNTEKAISEILQQVEAASRELNHDPHTHVDGTNLTISCTTHVPPGLSMKDVKLAKRIDQILEGISNGKDDTLRVDRDISQDHLQNGEMLNMEAIKKAKEDCNCE